MILTAMRRASSRVSSLAADRRPGSSKLLAAMITNDEAGTSVALIARDNSGADRHAKLLRKNFVAPI